MTLEKNLNLTPGFSDEFNAEINFFTNKGYAKIEPLKDRSTNNIFSAEKDGQECFIKKYRVRDNDEAGAKRKAQIEIDCYEKLPQEDLIKVIEANKEENYLVLEKVQFREVNHTPELVARSTDLYLKDLVKVDCSFLPEFNWQKYNKFFEKTKQLEELGVINNSDKVIEEFKDKQDLIENSPKVFSHHDYNSFNVRPLDNKLIVFDFELACRDNAMYDMATYYIEIQDNENLKDIFLNKLKASELYNEDLFNLMIKRRAIDVMFGLKRNPRAVYYQKNKKAFEGMQ